MRTKTKKQITGYEFLNRTLQPINCSNISDLIQIIRQENGELYKTFVKEEKSTGNADYYIAYVKGDEIHKIWT